MGPLEPRDCQLKGRDFWLNNPRCYFAIDMGLGKTLITLLSLVEIKKPTLIIAPLRTIYSTWPEEIEKWNIPLTYTIVHGKDELKAINQKRDIYLTNFNSIPFIFETLIKFQKTKKPFPFEVCVIDEGSMIKSHKTKRFDYLKAMRALFPKYRAILSGTPAPNSLLDLWSQYFFLTDGKTLGENFYRFRNKYYTADQWNPYTFKIKRNSQQEILKRISKCTFRLDEKDYLNLPEITYNYISVDLNKTLRKQYQELKKEFLIQLEDVTCTALNAATLSMKLRQFLQGFLYYEEDNERKVIDIHSQKVDRLKSLVEETNSPILCAIQFKHEVTMIKRIYPNVPVIASGTSARQASEYIKKWNKGKIPLLLCHPASLAHGVNLQTGGNVILWFCQTWSLEHYLQFNKRLHRHGQKKGVVIHHLVVENTIDDKVSKTLNDKKITQQALLDYLKKEKNYD